MREAEVVNTRLFQIVASTLCLEYEEASYSMIFR